MSSSTGAPRSGHSSPVKTLDLAKLATVDARGVEQAPLQQSDTALGGSSSGVGAAGHGGAAGHAMSEGAEIRSSVLLRASDGMGINTERIKRAPECNVSGAPNAKTTWRLFQASVNLLGEIDAKRTITSILVEAQNLVASADALSLFYLYEPHKHCLTPIAAKRTACGGVDGSSVGVTKEKDTSTPPNTQSSKEHAVSLNHEDSAEATTAATTAVPTAVVSFGTPEAPSGRGSASIDMTSESSDALPSARMDSHTYLGSAFESTYSAAVNAATTQGLGLVGVIGGATAGLTSAPDSTKRTTTTAAAAATGGAADEKAAVSSEYEHGAAIEGAVRGGATTATTGVHKLVQCGAQIPLSDFGGSTEVLGGDYGAGQSLLDPAVVAFFSRKYVTRCARRARSPSAVGKQQDESAADRLTRERYCTLTVPVSDNANSVRALIKVKSSKCTLEQGKCIFADEDILAVSHLARLAGVALRNAALYNDAVVSRDLAEGVLRLIGSMSPELSVQSAVLSLTTNAKKIIRVKQCTVYLIDRFSSQLLLISSDITQSSALYRHFNFDDESSMFGECIKQGKAIAENLIETSVLHTRLGLTTNGLRRAPSLEASLTLPVEAENRVMATPRLDFGRHTDTRAHTTDVVSKNQLLPQGQYSNAAVAPILSECQQAIGLIELINKRDSEGYLTAFTDEDLLLIETLGRLVGPRLERSDLGHKAVHRRMSEAARADNLKEFEPRADRRPSAVGLSIPEEEEDAH